MAGVVADLVPFEKSLSPAFDSVSDVAGVDVEGCPNAELL
jgi:hypothetical protein